jgi:uncharacterized integral membrane protein
LLLAWEIAPPLWSQEHLLKRKTAIRCRILPSDLKDPSVGFVKKVLFLFIALVAFLVVLLASADNSEEVALRFLEYESPVWPISWWMISAFVVGVVFGNLLNVVSNTRLRIEARSERKIAQSRTQGLDKGKGQANADPVSKLPAGNH